MLDMRSLVTHTQHVPVLEVDWEHVDFLWNHDPPHHSIDEQGQQHIAQEDEDSHQDTNKELLRGIQDSPV